MLPLFCVLIGSWFSCHKDSQQVPVVVHVVRDPSGPLSQDLKEVTYRFDLTGARLSNGRSIMIATNEGDSFSKLLEQLQNARPEILILNSAEEIPSTATVLTQLGEPVPVCGGHPAYIPNWVASDGRSAAQTYLRFVAANCQGKR
jgi:hypothetical protein